MRFPLLLSAAIVLCAPGYGRAQSGLKIMVSREMQTLRFSSGDGEAFGHLEASELAKDCRGETRMRPAREGVMIRLEISGCPAPERLGEGLWTYVAWSVTPGGSARSLGEIRADSKARVRLETLTPMREFGLMVTAEPHFAVTTPGSHVVAKAAFSREPHPDYEVRLAPASDLPREGVTMPPSESAAAIRREPTELLQARQAAALMRAEDSDPPRPDTYREADMRLLEAEILCSRGASDACAESASAAAQAAEDARQALRRQAASSDLLRMRAELDRLRDALNSASGRSILP